MEADLTLKLRNLDDQSQAIIRRITARLEATTTAPQAWMVSGDNDPQSLERFKLEAQNNQKSAYELIEEEIDTVDGIYNELLKSRAEIRSSLAGLAKKVSRTDQNFANSLKTYFINDANPNPQMATMDLQSVLSKGDLLNQLNNRHVSHVRSKLGLTTTGKQLQPSVFQPKQIADIFSRYKRNLLNDSDIENYSTSQQNILGNTNTLMEVKRATQELRKRSQSGQVGPQIRETPVFVKNPPKLNFKLGKQGVDESADMGTQSIDLIKKLAAQNQNMANRYVMMDANPSFSDKKQLPQAFVGSKVSDYINSGKKPATEEKSSRLQVGMSGDRFESQRQVNSSAKQPQSVKKPEEPAVQPKKQEAAPKQRKYMLNNDSEDDEEVEQPKNTKQPYNPKPVEVAKPQPIVQKPQEVNKYQAYQEPKPQAKPEIRDSISEALDFSYNRQDAGQNKTNSVEFGSFGDDDFDDL